MRIKCVLFDAEGVIINSEVFSTQYERKYGIQHGVMLPFLKNEFLDCLVGNSDLADAVKPWLSKWKWDGSVDEFLQFWFESGDNVDENVVSTIKKLQKSGVKCCLATNQEKHRAKYMRNNMQFDELFDDLFISSEIGYRKPEEKFYDAVLSQLKEEYKILPHEVLFFDDSMKNVDAAQIAGINAHLYESYSEFMRILNSSIFAKQ